MASAHGKYARHVEELCDVLRAIMRGTADAATLRRFFARQIARGFPIHRQAISPEIPDVVMDAEARLMVLAHPTLRREWGPEARAFLRKYQHGKDHGDEGKFSWNAFCGGIPA